VCAPTKGEQPPHGCGTAESSDGSDKQGALHGC
jgi:hypothetical protein